VLGGAYTNLVPNPSAEVNATDGGWQSPEGTIARITTDSFVGSACWRLTASIVDPGVSMRNIGGRIGVSAGESYSFGAYVKGVGATDGRNVVCWIDWYDIGGTRISVSGNGPTTVISSSASRSSSTP
jgi:hypothetical protein